MAKAVAYTDKKLDAFVETAEYNPDELDRRIIRELSKNGRASYTEIAENMRVTPATVRNRLNKMIEAKIIKNFKPVIDKKLYNLDISALFMISLDSSKLAETIVNKLEDFQEITQITVLASNPNIVCTVYAENMAMLSMLLTQITQLDGIKDVIANFVVKSIGSGFLVQ